MATFTEFYENLGFITYPFLSFSAESEIDDAKKLFVKPTNYDEIIDANNKNITMIIVGERGTGKTALIYDLLRQELMTRLNVVISDYSNLVEDYSLPEFYWFIIQKTSDALFEYLVDKSKLISKLSHEDKLLLSYLLHNSVSNITKSNLREKILSIQRNIFERWGLKIYNTIRYGLNYGTNVAATIIKDSVNKHFNLPTAIDQSVFREYFPEITIAVDDTFIEQKAYYSLFERIGRVSKKLDISCISIIFDKIDEDQRLQNDAEKISSFASNIFTDNNFLLNPNYQVVISIWKTPFQMLKNKVRTQKLLIAEINWDNRDLENALNNRVSYYSNGRISSYLDILDESTKDFKGQILQLANRNPRDLWHLFDKILREQHKLLDTSIRVSLSAKDQGIKEFVKTFNYYEYYPKKASARSTSMDVYSYIRHLLKLSSPLFTKNQLNDSAGTGRSTINYVTGMENIGLITKNSEKQGNAVIYEIRDPKVIYALQNKIEIRKE